MLNHINYRSYGHLGRDAGVLTRRIPCDIDLVVGIPRSGLLAANVIALYMNRPLTDLEGYIEGRFIQGGYRGGAASLPRGSRRHRVLVVDDSVFTGNALNDARQRLRAANLDDEVLFAAVYVAPGREGDVDYYADVVDVPRVFDWNIMNHALLAHACVDIDGVLCRDPTNEENDDGDNYVRFLTSVGLTAPIPREIGCLVTSRLERYRPQTEAWLASHGIRYRRLVMSRYSTAAERRQARRHGLDKAAVYKDEAYQLFIESSSWQAEQIARVSGKCVYCVDERRMVFPPGQAVQYRAVRHIGRKLLKGIRDPHWAAQHLAQVLRSQTR